MRQEGRASAVFAVFCFCAAAPFALAADVHAACKEIYVFEAERLLEERDVVLIDVRDTHEYEDCRIKGSVNAPLDRISEKVETGKGKMAVFYCRLGARSAKACAIAEGMGFKEVFTMKGGITAWFNTGRPLEGRCEGRPYFTYGSDGRPVRPELESSLFEPDVKGCK